MRFIAVALVLVLIIGGMFGFILQQRASQTFHLASSIVIAPEPKAQEPVQVIKPDEASIVLPKTPLVSQPVVSPIAPPPLIKPSPAAPQPTTSQPDNEESITRISEENYVQVSIKPISLRDSENMISFEVNLNTHSVDLLQYKPEKQARLVIDGQIPITEGFRWEAKLDDSHHRSGILKLPALDAQANERISGSVKSMVLELDGVPGSGMRSFSWDVPASLLK